MIDLETLGTTAGCVVVSIGAVEFDRNGIGRGIEVYPDRAEQIRLGAGVSSATLDWWMAQSDRARAIFNFDTVGVAPALYTLNEFINDRLEQPEIWCNGANFDFPILEALYERAGKPILYKHNYTNCFRTLKKNIPRAVYEALVVRPVVPHVALEDARAQALTTIALLNYLEECYAQAATAKVA